MLTITNLSKTFNRGTVNERKALDRLDLHLRDGEFLIVVGGNGCGKSTIMNAVAGVFPVDAGTVAIAGQDVTRLPEHKRAARVGRVFQDPMMGTAAGMSIADNLALAMRRGKRRGLSAGISRGEKARYRALLARLDLGLEDRLSTRVGLLSGGQRQALTLLMATLQKPDILLLDEHTAALDPKTADRVLRLTDDLIRENHLTALMVTHNMQDAIRYGDRLVMMEEGRIIYEAAGAEKQGLTVEGLTRHFLRPSMPVA